MKSRTLIGVVASLAVFAVAPSASLASTVQISTDTLLFNAGAAETNNVTVSRDGANYLVTDPGSAITPSAPCAAAGANAATCPASAVDDLDVRLGDLNDTGTVDGSVTDLAAPFSTPVTMQGQAGDDTLNGAPNLANDLFGHFNFGNGPGADVLNGGAKRDNLAGSDGNDVLTGGGDGDFFFDGAGNDVVSGGEGNDFFSSGAVADGADQLSGGPNADQIGYDSRDAPVTVTLDDVADDGEAGEGDNVMSDVESASGGSGADVLVGSSANNDLSGRDGDDSIDGAAGADDLFGSDGADAIAGGAGNDDVFGFQGTDTMDGGEGDDEFPSGEADDDPDTIVGGPGSDLVDYEDASGPVTVTLDGVADDGVAGENDNAMADVEDVFGSGFGDTITGNDAANELDGGRGNDALNGLAGPDGLFGDEGTDALDGGGDPDLLEGGSEADRLRSRDTTADEAACGSGLDTVLADLEDGPAADCETVSTGVAIADQGRLKGDKATLEVGCPAAEAVDCNGKLTLTVKRKGKKVKLATGKLSIASGADETLKLELTKDGEDAAGNRKKVRAEAVATMTDAAGAKARTESRIVLKRAR